MPLLSDKGLSPRLVKAHICGRKGHADTARECPAKGSLKWVPQMPFPGLSSNELHGTLDQLNQALSNHERWHDELIRTIICRLPPDRRDVETDAHRTCRFGQWLYGPGDKHLGQYPALKEIESSHERMHRCARDVLLSSASGEPVPEDDYERFVTALKQMRLEVMTTKRELEDALYNVDPLSGAASRIGMLTKLREQQALVQRNLQSCIIAMMDFDHFKGINDTHGHAAGDHVLATVSKTIMHTMRPYDMLFRYGGEEFLICEPNTDMKSGHESIDRFRKEIASLHFSGKQDVSFQITASFGVTLLDPDATVEQAIERADKALYAAKAAGRNRVMIWDPSMV